MGKVFDYLKAATSEAAMSSALGRWRRKVSTEIDGGALGGGKNIQVGLTAPQSFSTGTGPEDVLFDNIIYNDGINYNPLTGIFTLEANKLYKLEFFPRWVNFATSNGPPRIFYAWVDAATDLSIISAPTFSQGAAEPLNNPTDAAYSNLTQVTFRTIAVQQAKVRTQLPAGSMDLAVGSYAIVQLVGQ